MADIKQTLMDKGDKIALGTALAILVGYLAVSFGLGGDAELQPLKEQAAAAEVKLGANPAPALKRPDYAPVTSVWAVDAISTPAGQRDYVAMFKTRVVPDVKDTGVKPPIDTAVPRFPVVPVMGKPDEELGQVTLKWTDGKPPAGQPAGAAAEYELYRQEAGKGWELLQKIPGGRKSHVDTSVEPKKKYAYKVKLFMAKKEKSLTGKSDSEFSNVQEATIPSGVVIVFEGGGEAAAVITVKKFMGGAWKERKYVVSPENEDKKATGAIGKLEREKNPDTGKNEEVDYRTAFILKEIRKEKFKYKRIERKPKMVMGADGQKHLETEEIEVDAEKERLKITYVNDDGKTVEQWAKETDEESPK